MSIYFIRHGESQSNRERLFAGRLDTPLTELGVSQAKTAGEELKASGIKIDTIVSSPLLRARDTAAEIAQIINYPSEEIILEPLLEERSLGPFEGKPALESAARIQAMSEQELQEFGVETLAQLMNRANEVLTKAGDLEGNTLLVSHNGLGRGLLAVLHSVAFYDIERLPNARVFDLSDDPRRQGK